MMYYSLFISITGFLIVADPFAEWKDRTSALDAKAEVTARSRCSPSLWYQARGHRRSSTPRGRQELAALVQGLVQAALRSSATEEAVSELAALTGLSMEGSNILLMAVSGNLNLAKELYFCNEAVQAQEPAALEPAATWSETSPSATQPPLRPLSRVVASPDRPLLLPNDVREHAGEKRRRWQETLWEMEEAAMNSEPLITFDKLVTKMAIMLRNVHGAAKKIKEVDSTALTYAGVRRRGKRQRKRQGSRERRRARKRQRRKGQGLGRQGRLGDLMCSLWAPAAAP